MKQFVVKQVVTYYAVIEAETEAEALSIADEQGPWDLDDVRSVEEDWELA